MLLILVIPVFGFVAVILFLHGGLYNLPHLHNNSPQSLSNDHINNTNSAPYKAPSSSNNRTPLFSVVIAARNEERNIEACLRSALSQEFGYDYEVIVINDRSDDATGDILREFASIHSNLKIVTIVSTPPKISPKKHAVTTGIKLALGEIVVFTDADCIVSPQWLSIIKTYFDDGADLVQGITLYRHIEGMNKIFFGLQSVDFLSHGIISAAAIGARMPINSNANNMAFRKKIFEEIGGYGTDSGVTLGDDDHLLQRFWRREKKMNMIEDGTRLRTNTRISKIKYMTDNSAAVYTAPTETIAALFEQRRRWGSVTVHYGIRQVILLFTVFLFYLTIPIAAIASVFNVSQYLPICVSLLFIKLCGELVLMVPGTRIFGKKNLRKYIVPASIIQLPTTLAAVLLGVFWKFKWKGQRIRGVVK